MPDFDFHPIIWQWFRDRLGEPTEPQRLGWPPIAEGRHTLIAAPTGSGKTLAAFLVCLDRLLRSWLEDQLEDEIQVVYVSPLKALSNDIHQNLEQPLAEIRALAESLGHAPPPIRTMVRTGDTPSYERQKMLRRPPHILVTTPESLYLMLTSEKSRQRMRRVNTVIVDEIHALARDKRGSHLSLSLERLDALCDQPPTRIGLSATQRPIDQIANFLVGTSRIDTHGSADCEIVDVGHFRQLDISVEVPPSPLDAICSHEQWGEVYERLTELIQRHRSTLVFVNTRRMTERVAHRLRETLGEQAVASHHGSLSRTIRLDAEQRLKNGQLRAIVATASLELGIDVGYIDLACQIGSPQSIATFLQRVGRSGHSLGKVPCGRLFPLTRDELIECLALVRAVRRGDLDSIQIPAAPLDILAQQIVAMVASEDWEEPALLRLCRGAWPYRNLSEPDFESVLQLVSEGVAPLKRGAHVHRDRIRGRLRARRGARIAAVTSGGAIPETAEYRVVTEPEKTFVGTVDEDFAIESLAGDVFLLGNTSWRIRHVRAGEVVVRDAQGAPPSIPFWLGEGPGRTAELSASVSNLREDIAHRLSTCSESADDPEPSAIEWIISECVAPRAAAEQAANYVRAGLAGLGQLPTRRHIVFERFFDETGGMQVVIHAPLGARVNRAWGLALRKRFCRSFDFELQASADNDGVVLSLSPQHSFPVNSLCSMIGTHNARSLLEQALLAVPMFQVRWRWNVTRALTVLRQRAGKKVPPYLQRFQADDLLAAVFPAQVGCLENHSGDVPIPDHPLVNQTIHDCLHEAMDLDGWMELLQQAERGEVQLVGLDTREPSPFSHERLNANPYAFLDPAPLEERRTRAVTLRRSLPADQLQDLGRLDREATRQVCREAWPTVRDAEELHDALMNLVVVTHCELRDWLPRASEIPHDRTEGSSTNDAQGNYQELMDVNSDWLVELVHAGRAARVSLSSGLRLWVAAERWPLIETLYPNAQSEPTCSLPASLDRSWQSAEALVELVRGRIQYSGPTTAEDLSSRLGLENNLVRAALEALEGEGLVLRGSYSGDAASNEWCDRRLLSRIHRITLDALRAQVQPVEPECYVRYLVRHHHLLPDQQWGGSVGLREAIGQLQGLQIPAGAWEDLVLTHRFREYNTQWLDHLFLSGEMVWGRLQPPLGGENNRRSMASLTRVVPICLLLREDLPWLLPERRASAERLARSNACHVLETLTEHGALFFRDILRLTQMLPGHLEESLRELAALGLATSDGPAAVRSFVQRPQPRSRRRRRHGNTNTAASPVGRWSRFPGSIESPERTEYLENWCRQLLRRWGIVFRDLMLRESVAPPWSALAATFRRLELRGEIRGGRFVKGVAGEQFATDSAIEQLRQLRDSESKDPWIVVAAADPINLVGILTPGPRIPATHKNSIIVDNGHYVAAKQASQVEFFAAVAQQTEVEMTRALRRRRRREAAPLMESLSF